MFKNRHPLLLPVITLFVGLPATLALMVYFYTLDPTLRPLGVSRLDAEKYDRPLADLEVVVTIFWAGNTEHSYTKRQLEQLITNALKTYDVHYRLRWRDILGSDVLTAIRVDHVEFGPFPVSELASAIPAAISAYRSFDK